jgi:aspartate--ammonia ligase
VGWERVITAGQRNLEFLKKIVETIYGVILRTEKFVCHEWNIAPELPENITFIHSEELLAQYPGISPKEREREACLKYGAIFVIGIGNALQNGEPHDGRAPDYDDWSTPTVNGYCGLNGDIVVYNKVLDCAFELSSMGIRVDKEALLRQLKIRNLEARQELYFHQRLLNGELPFQSAAASDSRGCVCITCARPISVKSRAVLAGGDDRIRRRQNIFLL